VRRDAGSCLREWTATAGAAWAAATAGDSARFLPAATYYGAAMAVIAETDGSVAEIDLWRRQRACWDRAVALAGGERLAIPYEDTALPGYFLPAPGSSAGERRPLVVIDHGDLGATSQALTRGGAAAAARRWTG
jgi:hypothetical protein